MAKFKKGDKVYYVSPEQFLAYDKSYEVERATEPEGGLGGSIGLKGDHQNSYYGDQAFISEEEYNSKKKPFTEPDSPYQDKFKPGDMAYYNGISSGDQIKFDPNKGYILWIDKNPDVFNLYIKGEYKQVTKDFVNKNFITPSEYKEKNKQSNVENYDSFVKRFKSGSIVYYIGDKIPIMKKDTPYKIEFYNPLTKLIKIGDDALPDDDFISEEQYEKLKSLNNDNSKLIGLAKEGEKTDVGLKMQIFRDTKDKKLFWFKPFPKNDEWYRTNIYLNRPKNANLRIDIKRPADLWEMVISYYRSANPISKLGGLTITDSPILIRKMKESSTLIGIIKQIENQIDKREDEESKHANLLSRDDKEALSDAKKNTTL